MIFTNADRRGQPRLSAASSIVIGIFIIAAVADRLVTDGVPFIFTTGYDASVIPDHFAHVPRCEKPVSIAKVVRAIGRAVHP